MYNYNSIVAMEKLSILTSVHRRLQFVASCTIIVGLITFVASLSVFNWACQVSKNYVPDSGDPDAPVDFDFNCERGAFNCHRRQAWINTSILAVIASVYQTMSSIFLFRSALGMRSWIIGNLIIGIFSVYFACFIVKAFPNLMAVYLLNLIALVICSIVGYFVKNMQGFEESSMALLS